jgi:hypothetical protein
MLEITDFMKETRIDNQPILSYYKEFFKQQKMTEISIVLKDLICTAMKNKNDNFDFQDPHQDYFPVAISSDNNKNLKKEWLAWSTIIPISNQGSWLTIWYDFQTLRTVEVKHGQVVFFRSDVVHCDGRPKVDMLQNQTYYRLHFFYKLNFSGLLRTKLTNFILMVVLHSMHCTLCLLKNKFNFNVILKLS